MRSNFTYVGLLVLFIGRVWASENNALLEYEQNTIDVYQKSKLSVVYIKCIKKINEYINHLSNDVPEGAGSGCVWDKKGHIITNYHVVNDARNVFVMFDQKNEFKANVVGIDSTKDLAVLKIVVPEAMLFPLPTGSKQDLIVGKKVLALGNPFGLSKTLTVGIISALERKIYSFDNRTIRDVIQTDAAINPGNSGGPLLDSKANLIGINTAIITTSGSNAGIGFAIPIHTIKKVVPELIEFGRVRRAGLGIITLRDNNIFNSDTQGVAILSIPQGSTAESAGFEGITKDSNGKEIIGDIITKLDDTPIKNNDDLSNYLEQHTAGDRVTVTILRKGKEVVIPYTLKPLNK